MVHLGQFEPMCISPIMIKNKNNVRKYSHHSVPCGKCYECRKARGAGWAFRLKEEERNHDTAYFLTLTYDDDHLPGSPDGLPTLVKSDLQKFFKMLRKRQSVPVKYYACGEYGTRTFRPHYHAIVFGAREKNILSSWKHGNVHIGEVTPASVSYVVGYMNKPHVKITDDREPEFSVMSKGLGLSYVNDKTVRYHKENLASFVTLPGGVKTSMPRYLKQKIFDEKEREIIANRAEILHEIRLVSAERKFGYYVYVHNTNEAIKAAIKRQSFNLKNKRFLL